MLILQPHRIAQLLKSLEELVITKEDEGQDLGLHLMVIQQSLINANLTMGNLKIVS